MIAASDGSTPPLPRDLVGAPDLVLGPEAQRASAALRRLARREDLKAAVLASAHLYPVLRRAAARYVAGETRDEAVTTARDLARLGHRVTVDHMGEDTRDPAAARVATDEFLALVGDLGPATGHDDEMASASVSLDLSHIGLAVPEEGPRLATGQLTEIAAAAGIAGREVMISMEGSERTAEILGSHAEVAERHPNVGVTIQAALLRTPDDLTALLTRPGRIRLVKGAYAEPGTTAHPRGPQLDAVYTSLARRLVEAAAGGRPVSVATHDPALLSAVLTHADWVGGPAAVTGLEIEMLHGVRPDRLAAVRARGYPTRTYLVYGQEWWLYMCHRLAEHPVTLLDAFADAVDALPVAPGEATAVDRMIASSARPGRG